MLRVNFGSFYSNVFVLLVIVLPTFVVIGDGVGKKLIQTELAAALRSNHGDTIEEKDANGSLIETFKRQYTLADMLQRTFSEFERLYENILVIVSKNLPKIARDTDTFLAKISNITINALITFSNKIPIEGDDIFNAIFYNIERQLDSGSIELKNFAMSVDEHFNWAFTQLNQTLINNTEVYDFWIADIKHKLRTINDTILYQDGCNAIDEFIISSTKKLDNCCKISMKPVRLLCESAGSLITKALHTIVDAIDRMQSCLEEKNSYLDYMLPCIRVAYDELSSLVSRATQITHQIKNILPMKIIYTRSCFAIVMMDMNIRQNSVESHLFP